MYFGKSGNSPEPFDAVDGSRLAGPDGSHPLHDVSIGELLRPTSGAVVAEFAFDNPDRPAIVGGGITGRVRFKALQDVDARSANLRLVGLKLLEYRKSSTQGDEKNRRTESWVEADGELFIKDAFVEPVVPEQLSAGQEVELSFRVPAPRLGPPTAHLGEAIIAWALELRWNVAMGDDPFAAVLLPVAQNPELQRAGVGEQGGRSLAAVIDCGDGAVIDVGTELPAQPGSFMRVVATWPGAPSGRAARVELWRDTTAPNGEKGQVSTVPTSVEQVKAGTAVVELPVPAGIAPSFDGAGVQIGYLVRVVIDRPMRPDASIERPVAIV
jgi:hypothetical protein